MLLIPNAAPVREMNPNHDARGRFAAGRAALQARSKMPQLGGHTPTAQLVRFFAQHGIRTTRDRVQASTLKPTQHQMKAATVRAMVANTAFEPGKKPIFISQDGFIVDGHHRVAAVVVRGKRRLGNGLMTVIRVHAPIGTVLRLAHQFAARHGIERKAA